MNSLSSHGLRLSGDPSRRDFLITMLGAGVMLGYARSPLYAADAMLSTLSADPGRRADELFEPTIWYEIDPGGTVTINIIRAEMGQHVGTALARIVADELEADWSKVRVVTVDSAPKWGNMITGGSWSVWQGFPVLSRAGAAGRIALIEEGAKLLGVPCSIVHGTQRRGEGRRKIYPVWRYRGARQSPTNVHARQLEQIPIKTPDERRLIGQRYAGVGCPVKGHRQRQIRAGCGS